MQVAGILLVFAMLAFCPPATGRMILIPLGGDSAQALSTALASGASLVGRGPFAGSVVIDGRRGDFVNTLYRHHVLMLAAPAAGCGATA
ncbi:MAG: hypothetical protein V4610_13840 [Pseudomonadota bacterium]|jgi:hypothetical protein